MREKLHMEKASALLADTLSCGALASRISIGLVSIHRTETKTKKDRTEIAIPFVL